MPKSDFTDAVKLGAVDLPSGRRLVLRSLRIRKRPCVDLRLYEVDQRGEVRTRSGFAVAAESWPAVAAFVAAHGQAEPPAATVGAEGQTRERSNGV